MAKAKSQFSCQSCGYSTPKWMGRCPGCGDWNSLVEERSFAAKPGGGVRQQAELRDTYAGETRWVNLADAKKSGSSALQRTETGIAELDRTLGGGMVADGFVLIGGDPGIGKSTLLLQVAQGLSGKGHKILYVSGEESVDQVRGRSERIGTQSPENIFVAAETQLERVLDLFKEIQPSVLFMDSLQTFATAEMQSAPGSVGQLREVSARLMTLAKSAGVAVWLVGHVTKDGSIAGPKVVEHMVDTVLYFEGDTGQNHRILRTVKNRFGSAQELGVFEMSENGLREVSNPSLLFLSERKDAVAGTAACASLEGTRPLLVELQALVVNSSLAMPRRTAVGMDANRFSMLAAIVQRHMRLSLGTKDLFFNVSGGMKLTEPACDLAAAAAIWSSAQEKSIPADWLFVGEISLTGEVRRVSHPDVRLEEARKLGFKQVVLPASVAERVARTNGLKLHPIQRLSELSEVLA